MKARVIVFPVDKGPREVEVTGETATLRQVLEQAHALPAEGELCDLAVKNQVVTDLETVVSDGATVSKTKRIQGG